MTALTAAAILTKLDRVLPIDGTEEAIKAISDALEDYADLTEAQEPYATRSIQEYRKAAEQVRNLWHRLSAEAEEEGQ